MKKNRYFVLMAMAARFFVFCLLLGIARVSHGGDQTLSGQIKPDVQQRMYDASKITFTNIQFELSGLRMEKLAGISNAPIREEFSTNSDRFSLALKLKKKSAKNSGTLGLSSFMV
jgi:hypothetical protein